MRRTSCWGRSCSAWESSISARAHLEQGLALHNRQQHRSVILNRGVDSEVVGCARLAWTLWILGYPDCALAKNREALQPGSEVVPYLQSGLCLILFRLCSMRAVMKRRTPWSGLTLGMTLSERTGIWPVVGRRYDGAGSGPQPSRGLVEGRHWAARAGIDRLESPGKRAGPCPIIWVRLARGRRESEGERIEGCCAY